MQVLRATAAALALAWFVPLGASAQDDVPPEIAARKNPVELDARGVAYYAKQFRTKCARCHGRDGAGGGEEAAAQAVPPANFTDAAFMRSRSDGQLFYQIVMGGEKRSEMPAFGPGSDQNWDEQKIWGMVAFIRRFAEPAQK